MHQNKTYSTSFDHIKIIKNTVDKNWYKCKVYPNGGRYYFNENDTYHRLNGPAIIYPSGLGMYYVDGYNITDWINERNIDISQMTELDWIILKTEIKLGKK